MQIGTRIIGEENRARLVALKQKKVSYNHEKTY